MSRISQPERKEGWKELMKQAKSFSISKKAVKEAYEYTLDKMAKAEIQEGEEQLVRSNEVDQTDSEEGTRNVCPLAATENDTNGWTIRAV